MGEENNEFKVVDKRFSATSEKETPREESKPSATTEKTSRGEGFVMKEKDTAEDETVPTQIDFSTLIFSLATGAMINLGLAPDPATHKTQKNLGLAKQNIDILCLLQAKTKGNLSDEEKKLLESLVAETQFRFVEASR